MLTNHEAMVGHHQPPVLGVPGAILPPAQLQEPLLVQPRRGHGLHALLSVAQLISNTNNIVDKSDKYKIEKAEE